VPLSDGSLWFDGVHDSIDGLAFEGDALVGRAGLLGTVRRGAESGIALIYAEIALLDYEERSTPAGGLTLYDVATAAEGACHGVCLADGRLLLPCTYDDIRILYHHELPFLLAHRDAVGYEIFDGQGKPLFARAYEWLITNLALTPDDLSVGLHEVELLRQWAAGTPLYAWRDGQGWRLYPDGREETEVAFQRARAFHCGDALALPQRSWTEKAADRIAGRTSHLTAGAANGAPCKALGDIYRAGHGVAIDPVQTCRWYASAAALGDEDGRYAYGTLLMEALGCRPDAVAARTQCGLLVPQNRAAAYTLGLMFEQGLGGAADAVRARAMYECGAGDDEWGLAAAQTSLGRCWRDGVGGAMDKEVAMKWFELATVAHTWQPLRGDPQARRYAAQLYCEFALQDGAAGRDKKRQAKLRKAMYYFKAMAKDGDIEGRLGMARCHLGVYGGAQQPDAARAHLLHALESEQHAGTAHALWDEHGPGSLR
jgi:TPR repeat protein